MKDQFLIDPNVTYLNHGSYGACPRALFEVYQHYQLELEKNPFQFIQKELPQLLTASRKALGNFIHCYFDDVVFFTNPTTAVNVIAKSLRFHKGDEILTTDIEYGACDRTWQYYCKLSGAKYVRQKIELPILSKEKILSDFWSGYTNNTKAIFISHISSATALILPVEEIILEAKKRGLITIIDGAHVPGHLPLDIEKLNPDFYVGACHKWMNGPKGASFLYTKSSNQYLLDPLIISWGYEAEFPSHSSYLDYHQMQGTRDMAAILSVPATINYFHSQNWWQHASDSRSMIIDNYWDLCDIVGTSPIVPVSSQFLGQMCAIPLPKNYLEPYNISDILLQNYKIAIPVSKSNDDYFLRLSTQVYIDQSDIELLKTALKEIFN